MSTSSIVWPRTSIARRFDLFPRHFLLELDLSPQRTPPPQPQPPVKNQFPDGESESPYVFICENPRELVVRFPLKGKHKIFPLDSDVHEGAKGGLQ